MFRPLFLNLGFVYDWIGHIEIEKDKTSQKVVLVPARSPVGVTSPQRVVRVVPRSSSSSSQPFTFLSSGISLSLERQFSLVFRWSIEIFFFRGRLFVRWRARRTLGRDRADGVG
jgi:hypothetical protein